MEVFKEVILDSIEALLLLGVFSVLHNQKKYIIENKFKSFAFCVLFIVESYWCTFYVSLLYHTLFIIVISILLLALITKKSLYSTLIVYSVFFIILLSTEALTEIIAMLTYKMNLNQIMSNPKYALSAIIISKILQIFIVGILFKFGLSLTKFKIFQKEGTLISNFILESGVFGLFIFSVNLKGFQMQYFEMYNIFILIIYFVFFIIGLKDVREREKILNINNKYKVQEKQIENMEEIISIIRQEKHDFANHINVIQALCCLNKPNTVDRIKEYVSKISDTIHSSFRYLDTGNDYIDGFLSIKSNYAMKNKIDFKVIINESFSLLKIKEDELISIISNLVDNAFEALILKSYTENRGISITTYLENNKFCIEIADNGHVIPEDIISKIFDKGFTTKNKQKDEHGYGLFITKQLVEQNNGSISVVSIPEKTKFLIEFVL